ncbi:MAG TPA: hypothetical protein VH643_18655 [Gemmataceae bacterium]|jgi:hypothetical protein
MAELQLSGQERVAVGEVADLLLASELLADRPACHDGLHITAALRHWHAGGEGESLAERVAHLDHFEGFGLLQRCKGVWLDWWVDTGPDASRLLKRMKAGDVEATRFYFALLRAHPDPEAHAILDRFADTVKEADGVAPELKDDFLRMLGLGGRAEGQQVGLEPRVENR